MLFFYGTEQQLKSTGRLGLNPIHQWILGLLKPPFPCGLIELDSARRWYVAIPIVNWGVEVVFPGHITDLLLSGCLSVKYWWPVKPHTSASGKGESLISTSPSISYTNWLTVDGSRNGYTARGSLMEIAKIIGQFHCFSLLHECEVITHQHIMTWAACCTRSS